MVNTRGHAYKYRGRGKWEVNKEGDMEQGADCIVIVGGGIGGLATALALHRKGIASVVLEKSDTLRADGAAIAIHANGWRALEELGVAAELRETANVIITTYHDVWQQGSNIRPVRTEFRCLKRKDLIETMAKNIPSGAIRFGCHVVAIHQDPGTHGAILTTVDGCTIRATVVIGCDGWNSVVAKYVGLSAPKTKSGTVLRGFTRYSHRHPFGTEFLKLIGEGFFVGILPISHNLAHFFLTMPFPPTGITKDARATKDSMLEKLRAPDCPSEIIELVRNSDPESLNVVNSTWYRPPWQVAFGTFHKGVVTVAGDAMHVLGPFIGQGGSSTLEDAVVLARSLSRAAGDDDYSAAIQAYVRERRPRVALLSLESFVMGTLLFPKSSRVTKLACVAVLALLGNPTFRHADYDCGRL